MSGSETPVTGCLLCGRPTYDPGRKERPWSRAVVAGRQVLICPSCQAERTDWMDGLDRCWRCGSTRLSVMLAEVVCRACGFVGDTLGPAGPQETPGA